MFVATEGQKHATFRNLFRICGLVTALIEASAEWYIMTFPRGKLTFSPPKGRGSPGKRRRGSIIKDVCPRGGPYEAHAVARLGAVEIPAL